MAKPIKETPMLTGEDAISFETAANNVEPASIDEIEQTRLSFRILSSIATFSV